MDRRSRIALWLGLMAVAGIAGLVVVALARPLVDIAFRARDELGTALLVATFALSWAALLVPFYYAAKAAAWAQLRGDVRALVLGWWLVGGLILILVGVASGHLVEAIVSAATFGVVRFGVSGDFVTPEWLVSLGAAGRFGLQFPYTLVLLIGFYLLAQRRMRSAEVDVEGAEPAGHPPA